jgi:hypothetical protein
VVDKLAGYRFGEVVLSSAAEEMAFRALVSRAQEDEYLWEDLCDQSGDARPGSARVDFDEFSELLNQDFDYELLFVPSVDGIEHSADEAVDFAGLKFDEWFQPFGNGTGVHPLVDSSPNPVPDAEETRRVVICVSRGVEFDGDVFTLSSDVWHELTDDLTTALNQHAPRVLAATALNPARDRTDDSFLALMTVAQEGLTTLHQEVTGLALGYHLAVVEFIVEPISNEFATPLMDPGSVVMDRNKWLEGVSSHAHREWHRASRM